MGPSSAAVRVYIGVTLFTPPVIVPAPFSLHSIVPLVAVAPVTVAVALEQIVCDPPAAAVGNGLTIML
ncbi:hypothetical protein D3C73_1510740 [compost metagenome]